MINTNTRGDRSHPKQTLVAGWIRFLFGFLRHIRVPVDGKEEICGSIEQEVEVMWHWKMFFRTKKELVC